MEFVGHQGLDMIGPGAAGAGTDEGEGDGAEAVLGSEAEGVLDGSADGFLGRGPEPSDAGDVDDGAEGEPAGAGDDGTAEGEDPCAGEFPEGCVAGALLDGSRDALGKQQPPGNEVAVPGVHDDLDGLFEEVAVTDAEPWIHADWTGLAEERFLREATDGRGLKGEGAVGSTDCTDSADFPIPGGIAEGGWGRFSLKQAVHLSADGADCADEEAKASNSNQSGTHPTGARRSRFNSLSICVICAICGYNRRFWVLGPVWIRMRVD